MKMFSFENSCLFCFKVICGMSGKAPGGTVKYKTGPQKACE